MTNSRYLLTAAAILLVSAFAPAEEPTRLDRNNLLEYRDGSGEVQPVKTPADWERRRAEIVNSMQQVMGKLPGDDRRVDLDMKVEEKAEADNYVRQLITYQAEPDARAPAYLCVPKEVLTGKRKAPAVICLHPADSKVGH